MATWTRGPGALERRDRPEWYLWQDGAVVVMGGGEHAGVGACAAWGAWMGRPGGDAGWRVEGENRFRFEYKHHNPPEPQFPPSVKRCAVPGSHAGKLGQREITGVGGMRSTEVTWAAPGVLTPLVPVEVMEGTQGGHGEGRTQSCRQEAVTLFCCSPAVCPWACPLTPTSSPFLQGRPLALVPLEKGQGPRPVPRKGRASAQAQWGSGEGWIGPAHPPAGQPGTRLSLSPSELGVEGGAPEVPSLPIPHPLLYLRQGPASPTALGSSLLTHTSQAGNSARSQEEQRLPGQWG